MKKSKKKTGETKVQLAQNEAEGKRNKNNKKKMKSSVGNANKVDVKSFELQNIKADETHEISGRNGTSKKLRNNKRKNGKLTRIGIEEVNPSCAHEVEGENSGKKDFESDFAENQSKKSRKKKTKNVESVNNVDEVNEKDDASKRQKGESKNPKSTKKSQLLANESSTDNLLEKRGEDTKDEVYEMSSGDDDYSRGMKKWITQYHQSRPGLKLLQERIDDFIVAHEAQEEQARAEREAQAAEGGWTVVVHHKGRKKTSDAESGVAVGSVAQAAVLEKMAKKKKKEVGLDFYRFQKREAHRNEIMMLQSKFEQDKKRIQQMRAARKFRPY